MNVLDLKSGDLFEYEGAIYSVMETTHTQQQQRRGLLRCRARDVATGKSSELVFRSDVKVEEVRPDEVSLTFLYADGSGCHFMDENTYEQVAIPRESVGEKIRYLKEGLTVTGLFHAGRVLDIQVPMFVDLKVVEAEPGFKGDTVTGARKRAKLETGMTVQVPLFVKEGDTVRIDTRTDEYLTRIGEE